MDGTIKIYPGSELKAVDMAELMKASLISDGVIQGCRLSLNAANTAVHMTSGRIVILGRMAEFAEGDLTPPTVSSDGTTCYICAVCDLSNTSRTFYVDILTESGKNDLDTATEVVPDDEFFNVSFGTRYFVLGTVTVSSAGALSSLTTNTDNYPIKSNKQIVADKISAIDHTLGDHQSHLSWLDNRRWNANKLVRDTIKYTSMPIPANSRARATVNIAYGSRYTATESGGLVTIHNTPGTDTGITPNTPDEYGRNTSVNPNHKVLAITGITFSNADVGGGANASKCVLAGFNRTASATDAQHHNAYIDIYNLASSAAAIDIDVHVLYALME